MAFGLHTWKLGSSSILGFMNCCVSYWRLLFRHLAIAQRHLKHHTNNQLLFRHGLFKKKITVQTFFKSVNWFKKLFNQYKKCWTVFYFFEWKIIVLTRKKCKTLIGNVQQHA